MKIVLSLAAAVAAGGALGFAWGFATGVGVGSDTIGYMTAHNRVTESLGRLDALAAALDKHDLAYSTAQHQRDLNAALLALGADAPVVAPHWQCKNAERALIANAGDYLKAHAEVKSGQADERLMGQALKFCQP
jgi:hypothetical protein